jgi:hypothetical protein
MRICKCLLALTASTVLLAAVVGTASAGRFSVSSQTFRATFNRIDFTGGFGTTECAFTVEGSFHSRTHAKVAGLLLGYVTRAGVGPCSRGSATVLTETLPRHIQYVSYSGTLPNLNAIQKLARWLGLRILEPVFLIVCLSSEASVTMTDNREAGGALTSMTLSGRGPTSCGTEGAIQGTSSSYTVIGSATRITVTLI